MTETPTPEEIFNLLITKLRYYKELDIKNFEIEETTKTLSIKITLE